VLSRAGAFSWDLLIKVGGSLGRSPALPALLSRVAALARRRRLLIVPGGGVFADTVLDEMRRHRLDEATAHRMALLAMDQFGLVLEALCPGSKAVADLRAARRLAADGRVPILLPARLLEDEAELERSFRLTSDSIAALLAGRIGAARLILLKSVDGPGRPITGRREAGLLGRRGLVDPLFAAFLPRAAETWIVNGQKPGELARLARRGGAASRRPRVAPLAG
jgi:aspartokinase-like uncharacterized kinase